MSNAPTVEVSANQPYDVTVVLGGIAGPPGPPGPAGVVIQADPPARTDVLWAETDATGTMAGLDSLWVPVGAFSKWQGDPTLANAGFSDAWYFGQDTAMAVAGTVTVPSHWQTFAVKIYWTQLNAGSGNVQWIFYLGALASGIDVGAFPELSTGVNDAVPGAVNTLKVSSCFPALANPNAPLTVLWQRPGDNAADTHAGTVAGLGLLFEKAS